MKYSEGDDWVYNYEAFAEADYRGRMEAAEELGPWHAPRKSVGSKTQNELHCPPIIVDENVKEVVMDNDGFFTLIR